MGVKFPGKKRYVTLECPRTDFAEEYNFKHMTDKSMARRHRLFDYAILLCTKIMVNLNLLLTRHKMTH